MVLEKLLFADTAGHTVRKAYDYSHYALAGLTPVAALGGEGSTLTRGADLALALVLPVHSHVAMNNVISDYVPKNVAGASRWAALGASTIALLGLMNLNLNGPGITATVKSLWKSPDRKA